MDERRSQIRTFWSGYSFAFTSVVVLANAALMAVAWHDRSWIALGIVMLIAPATNVGLAVASILIFTSLPNRTERSFSRHAILSVTVPALALVCDFLQFSVMNTHAC